ncbi:YbhB/YbcL family Raf kinase inhibitor-like protein [Rhodoblastus acidophilus]|uniref:YbhB/YbcL family Raf kinase inhibitor-like protein n=1 Tax=Candidatus Rhodoblastus alkanivorans TaxID=2954117 RepID=A0ABS9Z477_9HYPH|nr:YbhB/YbcL family Raf kinase inhibitor-like protein [Candidatus Rhodoblastus alkanivorans]MCI4680769.1 YbhB/YbcL family Raf kinase inhibitor-like protein [Candidatus Rhodoblastus alkanivorans]MCI4682483.1 YbhB/YbcL family Raf kinase inhibitor-like protein [Candidatus Rhodoblastus alkanivorans]MDI4639789.1 YbhB/YbcL family Raf kinase inhibitor-like protein [Rhodoblastus acidophilus]
MALLRLLAAALFLASATAGARAFELKSPDIAPGGGEIGETFVNNSFGCHGGNLSPALVWRNPPPGAKSFAITVHDPDAPVRGGFWHWAVYNIPVNVTGLPQGAGDGSGAGLPAGAKQVANDFGRPGYGGPCPPKGDRTHHYHFTVYALKTERLALPPHATASAAGAMIGANALGKASLIGTYGH